MDTGSYIGSAAKGSAIRRSGGCWLCSGKLPFYHSLLFLTMCSSLACLFCCKVLEILDNHKTNYITYIICQEGLIC